MKKVNVKPRINQGEFPNLPKGEIIGYIVDEGTVKGKRKRTTFKTKQEADAYAYKIDVAREAKQLGAVNDLGELIGLRSELMYCWERLKSAGATFKDAVDYYLTHYRSSKGNISVIDAMEAFKKSKVDGGCSAIYLESLNVHHYPRFLKDFDETKLMNAITSEELRNHVYHKRWKEWSPVTRTNYIKNISALFNFCVNRQYLMTNPCDKVERPKHKDKEIGYLSVPDVKKLFSTALEYEWFDRITIYSLVLFCGIRIEEASKMKWGDIDLKRKIVTVGSTISKMNQRRINELPDNAFHWITLSYGDPEKSIIEGGWEGKMKLLREKSGIKYSNNAARHSYGTYHFALFSNPQKTAVNLGHVRDITTLYRHYRNVVGVDEGKEYFNIYPKWQDFKKRRITQPLKVGVDAPKVSEETLAKFFED